MTAVKRLAILNRLKEVQRGTMVGKRHESTAEHTFSAMAIAQYYLKRTGGLDEHRVLKLLLFHDIVEIHAGDAKAWEGKGKLEKERKERQALERLMKELPRELAHEVKVAVREYEAGRTREAKFAHAIDNLDAVIQARDDPAVFRKYGLSVAFLKRVKGQYFEPFPILKRDWERHLEGLVKRRVTSRA